ncbi:MAG TPA: radical SAM protein [Pseudomonadales bacterium]
MMLHRVRLVGADADSQHSMLQALDVESPAIVAFSSYLWNHALNLKLARTIKERFPSCIIMIGGPEIPKREAQCEIFLRNNPFIDLCARGEGEITFAATIDCFRAQHAGDIAMGDFSTIEGLMFLDAQGALIKTPDRTRIDDLDALPSAYLSGELDHLFQGDLNMPRMDSIPPFLAIETNRGCPYGCTFCDWGSATLEKIHKFSEERVYREIEYAAHHKVPQLLVCDANFGIFERDVAFTQFTADLKNSVGYPQAFWTNFAKNASPKLADITRILNHSGLLKQGLIAIQSTDPEVLKIIDRSNIKTAKYEKLLEIYHKEKLPIGSDLMIGLPGQTYESYINDLQFFFDRKVATNTFVTSSLTNAPISDPDYVEKYKIKTNEHGFITSTFSFTEADLHRMFDLNLAYEFLVKMGVLRYFLLYLQIDHKVPAIRFIDFWISQAKQHPEKYPKSAFAQKTMLNRSDAYIGVFVITWSNDAKFFFHEIGDFYNEVLAMALEMTGKPLPADDALSIMQAQIAVMPKIGKKFPETIHVQHDVVAYFDQIRDLINIEKPEAPLLPLSSFPAADFTIPEQKSRRTLAFTNVMVRENAWELQSPLRFF